jgi:folate-binding protein YgfZ
VGFETDHRTIPHELGWLDTAVHLNKGCYRGQETVARVHNLGRPPRRLVLLHLDGSVVELPSRGASVVPAEDPAGRALGFVGTAVRHYELGPIALAVIKRNTPVEATLLGRRRRGGARGRRPGLKSVRTGVAFPHGRGGRGGRATGSPGRHGRSRAGRAACGRTSIATAVTA